MVGVEAGGRGIKPEQHAARFQGGSLGVLQGTRSYILQDEFGQIQSTHSVSAGLDYAAVGPEHAVCATKTAWNTPTPPTTKRSKRFMKLARLKASSLRWKAPTPSPKCIVRAPKMGKDTSIIVNLSGRGDKDVAQVAAKVKLEMPK